MDCPKCKSGLVNGVLGDMLLTKHCTECEGDWISAHNYQSWQSTLSPVALDVGMIPQDRDLPYTPSPLDSKTVPCPECGRILSRGKIPLREPFYIEHCLTCSGTWCDRGEWTILEQLNLHTNIPQIFSSTWQAQVRANHLSQLERQAVIDKVGVEIAQQVFDLADTLSKHPNGDFAVAYLMRSFKEL